MDFLCGYKDVVSEVVIINIYEIWNIYLDEMINIFIFIYDWDHIFFYKPNNYD
jgi:hypothetical protein